MSEVVTVTDLKKRMRLVVNTLTKDYDGFNHLDSISRKLMEIEGDVDYMTDKLGMRREAARSSVERSGAAAQSSAIAATKEIKDDGAIIEDNGS